MWRRYLWVVLAVLCVASPGFAERPGGRSGKAGPGDAPAAKQTAPVDPDKKLYEAKCGRCHEAFTPGVSEMTWNRWIWKWKDKARLTDEEYDRLMGYARRVREARQTSLAEPGAGK